MLLNLMICSIQGCNNDMKIGQGHFRSRFSDLLKTVLRQSSRR